MLPAINHHPELRAPVADVIVANDFVPKKFRDPSERVAQNDAADMADMHRLGDIRRPEVDHDAVSRFGRRHAQPVVTQELPRPRRHGRRLETEINKAGAGNGGSFRPFLDIEVVDDLLRQRARIFTPLLGQHESGIRLIIAEARIRRRDHFANRREVGRRESAGERAVQKRLKCFHEEGRKLGSEHPPVIPIRRRTERDLAPEIDVASFQGREDCD